MDLNLKKLSDNQLLNAYLSGNENAITALVNRHRRRIFDYIHMMVKDRDVADDIFQETLIRVLRFVNDAIPRTANSSLGCCASPIIR